MLRVAVNKLERLCTKQQVIDSAISADAKLADLKAQVSALSCSLVQGLDNDNEEEEKNQTESPIGKVVTAEVQLVKDYGLICQI